MIAKIMIGVNESKRVSAPSIPPSFVKSAITAPTSAADSHAVAFSGGVTAGNLIIVAVSTFASVGSGEVASGGVTDSLGNTYTRVVNVQGVTSTTMWLSIHVAQNTLGGACTVTANAIGSSTFHTISAHEYSGAVTSNAVDVSAIQRNVSSISAPSPTTSSTTIAADLVFAAMTYAGATTTISTPTIGYTQRTEAEDGSSIMPINTADKTVAATGTQIATWTLGAARESLCGIITIKGSGAGSPPDTQDPSSFTLSSLSQTSSTIDISWTAATDNVGVVGYDIYVEGSFHSTTTSLSATIGSLTASTPYPIYVDARDAAGNTTASNSITPSTSASVPSSGNEIFRMVSTGAGWEYLDPDTDVWTAMTLYPAAGGLSDGIGFVSSNSVTIRGKIFSNTGVSNNGRCLAITGDNVTVEYCIFRTGNDLGIISESNSNITVRYSLFVDLSWGILGQTVTNGFKILNCQFLNMEWDRQAINCCRGQSIFMNTVIGTGNEIANNHIENNTGEAFNEDQINTFSSGGTSGSRFLIHHNLIRGGEGSPSGGGIIFGDNGSDYADIYNNDMIDPGWYGIQVYGGDNCRVTNNRIYSVPGMPWNSVGFLIYNGSGTCTNMTMNTTNTGRYYRGNFYGNGYYPFENGGGCSGGSFAVTESTTLHPGTGANGMDFPTHLIDFVSEDDYWKLRNTKFRASLVVASHEGDTRVNAQKANVRRPTANAGPDQLGVAGTSVTLNASGSSLASGGVGVFSFSGYLWTKVSGPSCTITSSTAASTTVTGLSSGTYIFRLRVQQNNNQFNLKTYHSDWVTVTKS